MAYKQLLQNMTTTGGPASNNDYPIAFSPGLGGGSIVLRSGACFIRWGSGTAPAVVSATPAPGAGATAGWAHLTLAGETRNFGADKVPGSNPSNQELVDWMEIWCVSNGELEINAH